MTDQRISPKTYAGFGIILDIDKNGEVKILVVMEDPTKKKGGSRWKNFFFKFPGGNLNVEERGNSPKDLFFLSGFKIMAEVCGLSFERLGNNPFFSFSKDNHFVNFYLAKLEEGEPRPCKNLKLTEMAPEKSLRVLLEKNRFLAKHGLALKELFRCLNLIRSGKKIPEYALPLGKYYKEATK